MLLHSHNILCEGQNNLGKHTLLLLLHNTMSESEITIDARTLLYELCFHHKLVARHKAVLYGYQNSSLII